jgi:stage II sporulation protein D
MLAGITVIRKTPSGRARELLLTGGGPPVRLAASSFRFAVGRALGFNTVRSDRWEVIAVGGRLNFGGFGEGHGVGLCQKGADQMGIEGHGYREILAFYYSGAVAGTSARGIAWTRLGGESVAVFTTQPDRDGPVLALAERQLREVAHRLDLPVGEGIEIRLYPDLDAFRNSTGEPGWVAGRTTGRRIELQPVSVLRSRGALESTLRHELIHAMLEAQAAPNLPVWFREGLAMYLTATALSSSADDTADVGIRQREDVAAARRANAAAGERVAALVKRYGLGTVISWLKSGLPREVATAKASSAPTANK